MVVKRKLGPGVLALPFKGHWSHTTRDYHKVPAYIYVKWKPIHNDLPLEPNYLTSS